jgi:Domain of unknown function (DUF305)
MLELERGRSSPSTLEGCGSSPWSRGRGECLKRAESAPCLKDPQMRQLATDIVTAQEKEIAGMKAWLGKNDK